MLVTTMNDVPGRQIVEVYGEVTGLTVRARNVGVQLGESGADTFEVADLHRGHREHLTLTCLSPVDF